MNLLQIFRCRYGAAFIIYVRFIHYNGRILAYESVAVIIGGEKI
jgi:hypothetical protein